MGLALPASAEEPVVHLPIVGTCGFVSDTATRDGFGICTERASRAKGAALGEATGDADLEDNGEEAGEDSTEYTS